jgi:transposase
VIFIICELTTASFGHSHHHINGIATYWNQAKCVLRKYNGIPKESLPLFLKECGFRFNYRTPKQQLAVFKNGLVYIQF